MRLLDTASSLAGGGKIHAQFDPMVHLSPKASKTVIKMSDIGLDDNIGVSSSAICEPFPLFSEEAIAIIRKEVLDEKVIANFSFSSNINPMQLRGYGPQHAPFTFSAWKHPKTLKTISEAAGVDVVPVMDYEIGHVNISTPDCNSGTVVNWHLDSYPFVCVVMLSDCTSMIGGETALKTGTGEVIKVRGPERGYAVVLQGRYITHQALQALGGQERITMVTSFRPKYALMRDDTALGSVRPVSNLHELYYQYASYRVAIATERIDIQIKNMERKKQEGKLDVGELRDWFDSLEAFVRQTKEEIVEEKFITKGYLA